MKCPTCESDNTQRLEVAYQFGTQDISTQSNTAGVGLGMRGGLGIGGAVTSTKGQSQSILAQNAAPPARKSYKWPLIIFLSGFATYGVGCLIGGYFCYQNYLYNNETLPELYQHWTKGWMCHKCGNTYYQE